ncbi:TonB-dependent receptor [Bacteroidales bacterium OttesenSCG-928-B11]|nr:TonB-dependent receptor [Bacteroidales bacterium OttesenSCG-928-E04]MDL2312422.1 TonB-dependent receptor [Bacteroidales bacterium OttesenSCG-928-B11]MDL2326325.1 TonB-dependent receptor [Bacteroidales bacterium OttesenSCG-928-A14]
MRNRFFLLLILILPFQLLLAQRGSISGVLIDNITNDKVGFAGVILLSAKDTLVINGAYSEEDGSFSLSNVEYGDYLVQTNAFGFEKWISNKITVSRDDFKINLDTIRLTRPANMLNTMVVSVQKPLFETRHGTLTMNVEADPTAAGDNVLELLKKMPSVMVDHEEEITIEGKSGVTILIDDKPTHLSGDDLNALLKSMPSDMVEKIEVMSNPSARYDAEGTGGIINIVTKKEKRLGINGSVSAGIGYSGHLRHNEGVTLNARTGKLYLSGSYSYNNRKSANSYRGSNQYHMMGDTIRQTTNELDDELWGSNSQWQSHNFSLGGDYTIDKKNSIGIFYRGNLSKNKGDGLSVRRYYTNNIQDSLYKNESNSEGNSYNQTLNLNYKHSFDTTGKDMYVDFIYSNNKRQNSSENPILYYIPESEQPYREESRMNITDPTKTQVYTLKVDYEHPFTNKVRLNTGLKTGFVKNENNNFQYRNEEFIDELENHFIYKESITAGYLEVMATLNEKIDARFGLRGEYTWLEGEQLTSEEKSAQSYPAIFPSLSVTYNMKNMNNIGFYYRNSIYRPGYYNLNPYVNVSDPNNWSTGNPLLRPQYAHNFNLSYSWKYKITFSMGYNYTMDSYTNMTYTDEQTGIRLSKPENIGKSHSLNANVSARFRVGKWWNMNYYIGANYGNQIFDYRNEVVSTNVFGNWFYFSESFSFLKNYAIDISGHGQFPSISTFGRNNGRININAGFKANLLDKKLTLRLSINDLFNNGFWSSDYVYPDGSTSKSESRWESRSVYLTASYRFGKQDIQPRNRRNSSSEEHDRMGNGSEGGEGA